MEINELQNLFFQEVKSKLPAHVSLVDEVAELLGISNDSAYRRIRGEKHIALNELQLLSLHFKISLDQLMGIQTNSFVFFGSLADNANFNFEKYLLEVLENLTRIESLPGKQIFFDAKDIPIFHHFQFGYLAAFKYFFWQRVVLQNFRSGKKMFEPDEFLGPIIDTGRKVYESYSRIPSNELWNHETINSTFKQIEFCTEAGMFKDNQVHLKIYEDLLCELEHFEHEAEIGEKYVFNSKPGANPDNFKLYLNEVLLGHNTLLVDSKLQQFVSVNHNTLNFMVTHNKNFFDYTLNAMQNMIRKSNLISVVNEKERGKFFKVIKERIREKLR